MVADSSPNAIELLTKDHREVEALFETFEKADVAGVVTSGPPFEMDRTQTAWFSPL